MDIKEGRGNRKEILLSSQAVSNAGYDLQQGLLSKRSTQSVLRLKMN